MRLGKAIGNDAFQDRLSQGNNQRDDLVQFAIDRLRHMNHAQQAELAAAGHLPMRAFSRSMADSHKTDVVKPEPMRWGESARLYQQATYQLCRGDLSRGSQLLEEAIESERRAREALGKNIEIEEESAKGPEEPAAMGEIVDQQACAPRDLPAELALAEQIQHLIAEIKPPPVKKRGRDPWWTDEEEEEEEDGEGASS